MPTAWRLAATLTALLGGCASLSPAAQAIKIAAKSETRTCRFLQVVYGEGMSARSDALEKAALLHATHIVTLYDEGGKYTADALDCNAPAAAAPVAAAGSSGARQAVSAPTVTDSPPARRPPANMVIAVMEVELRGSAGGISAALLQNLSSQLRIFIAQKGVRTVDRGAQESAVQEQIARAKSDSYASCVDSACQIELGKALAASHILRSEVSQFGRSCVLNAELIDLKAEVSVAAATSRGSCEDEGFFEMSERVAASIVGR
jgi:hypothetical protein